MSEHVITRRSFLAGSAGVATLAGCAGFMNFTDWQQASASTSAAEGEQQTHTLCDGCGNQCGVIASVKDGRLWRILGDEAHPNSHGRLCGRGQGFAMVAYSPDRITAPLKKNEKGGFEQITWDQAYAEIAEKVKATAPEGLASLQARGTASFFTQRFINAMGSPNSYTDAAVNDLDISSVIEAVSGAYPAPDVGAAKVVVLLDKSTYDGLRPAEGKEFAELRERGAELILVDPRMTAFGRLASDWVPIRPGTELAFLLGVSGEIIRREAYDTAFIEKAANGFDVYAEAVKGYTLDWASEKTSIPADKLAEVTTKLIDAAPACFIDLPWAGSFGCGYKNSAETLRALLLANALLGNYNQPGGWLFGSTPQAPAAKLDPAVIKPVPKPASMQIGMEKAPLSWSSAMSLIDAAGKGSIKTLFLVESNPVREFPSGNAVVEALDKVDCLVSVSMYMNESSELADYVLPLDSYMERRDTVKTVAAKVSVVTLRSPVLERIHPETRRIDEVFTELAKACGIGEFFNFTIDDYNKLNLDLMNVGVSLDELQKKAVIPVPKTEIKYGSVPYMRTQTSKLDFTSEKFAKAGYEVVPAWIEPEVATSKGKPRLMIGEQILHTRTYTVGDEYLMGISKEYELDGAWINTELAESLGIKDGDAIELTTEVGSLTSRAKVTSRIHPEAVWMPNHYGCTAEKMSAAGGFGASPQQLIPQRFEPGTGAAMMHEVSVTVKKVGA